MIVVLPVTSSRSLKRLLRHRSNRVNGMLLAAWVITTVVLACFLWLRLFPVAAAVPTGVAAVVLAAVYFGFCCHCLEKSM